MPCAVEIILYQAPSMTVHQVDDKEVWDYFMNVSKEDNKLVGSAPRLANGHIERRLYRLSPGLTLPNLGYKLPTSFAPT